MKPRARTVGRRLFVVLYVAVLALFAAGYAARYVHPRHLWGLQLVAIGLPLLALVVVALTVPVVRRRRWGLLAVHLGALALIGVRFFPVNWFAPRAEAPPGAPALTVMTYNVGWGVHRYAGRPLPEELAAVVRAEAPDLIAFQEGVTRFARRPDRVRPENYLRPLFDSLGYHTRVPDGSTSHLSKSVVSRLPLERLNEQALRHDDGEVSELVRVEFTWQGRRAVLYNLHLQSFGARKPWHDGAFDALKPASWISFARQFRRAFLHRAWQIEQLRRMIDAEMLPVLVCGDFNNTPHNWGYREMTSGLTDAFAQAGRGWGATYHVRLPFVRIDYVLAGPEWVVEEAHVTAGRVSDHRPLVVRLRWRE